MTDAILYWAEFILRHVPLVTWVGLLLALMMVMLWFTKRMASTPVLALVCVLYAITPYLPAAGNTLPH